MSLENVLEKISNEQIVANQDLNTVSPAVLPYKKGQVRAAKDRLELLRNELKQETLKRSVFIVVTGDQNKQFAEIAEQEFRCYNVSANQLATDIVNKMSDQLYLGKALNANTFEIVDNLLEDRMKDLDIASYNRLAFNAKYLRNIKNKQEMIDLVSEAIADSIGSEVLGLDALERVVDLIVESKKASRVVPIVLTTNNDILTNDLQKNLKRIASKVFSVSAGQSTTKTSFSIDEINEETVGNTLKQIATNA
jgi:hypothetical protein